MTRLFTALAILSLTSFGAFAQSNEAPADDQDAPAIIGEAPMTLGRMAEIVFALDPNAQNNGGSFQMVIDGTPIVIITDVRADRMRAMTPIREAAAVSDEELRRMMQANFDTALDARYAIAQGTLWATFIHPLAALEKDQLLSALGQTINLARTYGTLYSGGGIAYGQGDSTPLQRQLIEELLQQGEEI
ncbi:type III secretion system chaperone [Rhodobacteraceae bacterium]|nr:type III secretion system chaperone [Paracoccaceae bacterium]